MVVNVEEEHRSNFEFEVSMFMQFLGNLPCSRSSQCTAQG